MEYWEEDLRTWISEEQEESAWSGWLQEQLQESLGNDGKQVVRSR